MFDPDLLTFVYANANLHFTPRGVLHAVMAWLLAYLASRGNLRHVRASALHWSRTLIFIGLMMLKFERLALANEDVDPLKSQPADFQHRLFALKAVSNRDWQ
jgi:hypothetical protein